MIVSHFYNVWKGPSALLNELMFGENNEKFDVANQSLQTGGCMGHSR